MCGVSIKTKNVKLILCRLAAREIDDTEQEEFEQVKTICCDLHVPKQQARQ